MYKITTRNTPDVFPRFFTQGMDWPDEVEMLESHNLLKKSLGEWVMEVFPTWNTRALVMRALQNRIFALTGRYYLLDHFEVEADRHTRARIWNVTMLDLGYSEGNPET